MRDVELHGCRNIVNLPGRCLPGLASLTALTSLSLRNCDGLQDGALCSSALTRLLRLDLSGEHLTFLFKTHTAPYTSIARVVSSKIWLLGMSSLWYRCLSSSCRFHLLQCAQCDIKTHSLCSGVQSYVRKHAPAEVYSVTLEHTAPAVLYRL